jgi:hypothetical protein
LPHSLDANLQDQTVPAPIRNYDIAPASEHKQWQLSFSRNSNRLFRLGGILHPDK